MDKTTIDQSQSLDAKIAHVDALLHDMGSVLVAFSGGTDSSLMAALAHRALGAKALAVTGVSPTFPQRDRDDATLQVRRYGWAHRFIETDEVNDPTFASNPPDRCYHCKSELFGRLLRIAADEGFRWVIDGSNTDDVNDYRPGARAKCDLGVRSPLQEAGFDKPAVREAARRLGLETADKPASACLASRFPYGTSITAPKLRAVELAETALGALGFSQVRVRAHDDVARIELAPSEIARLSDAPLRQRITKAVRDSGFRYVTLDLEGYRMGSLNEALDLR